MKNSLTLIVLGSFLLTGSFVSAGPKSHGNFCSEISIATTGTGGNSYKGPKNALSDKTCGLTKDQSNAHQLLLLQMAKQAFGDPAEENILKGRGVGFCSAIVVQTTRKNSKTVDTNYFRATCASTAEEVSQIHYDNKAAFGESLAALPTRSKAAEALGIK